MSKVGELLDVIRDTSGRDQFLHDYHAAKAAINGGRRRDFALRFAIIKSALSDHNVSVSCDGTSSIRVFNQQTGSKFFFPGVYGD